MKRWKREIGIGKMNTMGENGKEGYKRVPLSCCESSCIRVTSNSDETN